MSNREWTDAENELLLAITHRGQARPGAWAAVAEILDRQERTVRQRAGTLRRRAGLPKRNNGKAKAKLSQVSTVSTPEPERRESWWKWFRRH